MFKTLRLQLRFLLPLAITLVAAAYLAVPLLDQVTLRWFARDLNSRGQLVAGTLSDNAADAIASGRYERLRATMERVAQDERLFAMGLCSPDGRWLVRTSSFPRELSCQQAETVAAQPEHRLNLAGGPVHLGVHPVIGMPVQPLVAQTPASAASSAAQASSLFVGPLIEPRATPGDAEPVQLGELVLVHDLSLMERRSQDTRRYLIVFLAVLGFVIAVITMVVAQLRLR
jgi:trehalose 6-phosphate synthase